RRGDDDVGDGVGRPTPARGVRLDRGLRGHTASPVVARAARRALRRRIAGTRIVVAIASPITTTIGRLSHDHPYSEWDRKRYRSASDPSTTASRHGTRGQSYRMHATPSAAASSITTMSPAELLDV